MAYAGIILILFAYLWAFDPGELNNIQFKTDLVHYCKVPRTVLMKDCP